MGVQRKVWPLKYFFHMEILPPLVVILIQSELSRCLPSIMIALTKAFLYALSRRFFYGVWVYPLIVVIIGTLFGPQPLVERYEKKHTQVFAHK